MHCFLGCSRNETKIVSGTYYLTTHLALYILIEISGVFPY